jgi:uncharacterized cupin superfamily protein
MIPNYRTVSMRDNIYQPGASTSGSSMANDMVCHMLEGELTVDTGSGDTLYKKGDVWSCAKGMPERSTNTGSTVAIMRVSTCCPDSVECHASRIFNGKAGLAPAFLHDAGSKLDLRPRQLAGVEGRKGLLAGGVTEHARVPIGL